MELLLFLRHLLLLVHPVLHHVLIGTHLLLLLADFDRHRGIGLFIGNLARFGRILFLGRFLYSIHPLELFVDQLLVLLGVERALGLGLDVERLGSLPDHHIFAERRLLHLFHDHFLCFDGVLICVLRNLPALNFFVLQFQLQNVLLLIGAAEFLSIFVVEFEIRGLCEVVLSSHDGSLSSGLGVASIDAVDLVRLRILVDYMVFQVLWQGLKGDHFRGDPQGVELAHSLDLFEINLLGLRLLLLRLRGVYIDHRLVLLEVIRLFAEGLVLMDSFVEAPGEVLGRLEFLGVADFMIESDSGLLVGILFLDNGLVFLMIGNKPHESVVAWLVLRDELVYVLQNPKASWFPGVIVSEKGAHFHSLGKRVLLLLEIFQVLLHSFGENLF